jgi:hypothetical protein
MRRIDRFDAPAAEGLRCDDRGKRGRPAGHLSAALVRDVALAGIPLLDSPPARREL